MSVTGGVVFSLVAGCIASKVIITKAAGAYSLFTCGRVSDG